MYKALAYKELRETVWIGGMIFAAMVLVILDQIGGAVEPWRLLAFGMLPIDPVEARKIPFVHPSLTKWLALIGGVGGMAIGFRQVLGESFRSTWLFLLHRPAPRSRIVLTKLAVGIGLLLATTAIPVLLFAIWAALPGTHASPFDWRMTNVPLRVCAGATCVYLAAFLSGLREARWYGTRLFPLIFSVLAMTWVSVTVWWPVSGWIITLVVNAVYVAAILFSARVREY